MINSRVNPLDDGPPDPPAPGAAPIASEVRPLSPRSIILSVLLGSHPPEMAVGRILEFTSLFGIADGTIRTALSRLVVAGDLDSTDGVYRLSGRLLDRQVQQDSGRTVPPTSWNGDWWFAIVTAPRRTVAERREFRSRVVGARLAELRPDTWIRPANIEVPTDLADVLLTRGPLVVGDPAALTRRLWDLEGLERRAAELLAALDGTGDDLRSNDAEDRLPAAFVTLAAAQRFLRTEPQLPAALGDRRSADGLRARYDTVVRDFQRALGAFFAQRRAT